jgi:excisionase family DNA binding protein
MLETDRLLTLEEAGAYLHKAPKTVREWLRIGKLKGLKVGGTWRIRASDLEAFLEASRPPQARDPLAAINEALEATDRQ